MFDMDKFKKFLLDKFNMKIDYYNQSCFDWSRGYRKAIIEIVEYIKKNSK